MSQMQRQMSHLHEASRTGKFTQRKVDQRLPGQRTRVGSYCLTVTEFPSRVMKRFREQIMVKAE